MPDLNNLGYYPPINKFPEGQCTWYAFGRIYELSNGSKLSVSGNAGSWFNNAPMGKRYSTPSGQLVACWSGGSGGYGHVAVVESYNATTKLMTFSDCNYNNDGKIITRPNITEKQMKNLFGASYTFQGYIGV